MTRRTSLGRRSLFAGALLAALVQTGCAATRAHEALMNAPGAIVARVFTEPSLVARWKSMRDVEVRLQGPLPEGTRIGRTDSCGAVAFEGLPDGTYSLTAGREGLETVEENIAVTRGKDAMIDVKLKAQDAGAAPAAKSSGCTLGRHLSGLGPMYTPDAVQHDVQGCLVVKCVVTFEEPFAIVEPSSLCRG